ncbi:hypothetical protein M9H77_21978 [Catharanthus roseus]|uniref:Uncharacterized protein n=1 Tax=Catharanthus roseus TaxID=4058 RepID=A0ACC0AQM4_CATRO|nr:hypothetical protein M9H77_21978 [Catharanthus roseus]
MAAVDRWSCRRKLATKQEKTKGGDTHLKPRWKSDGYLVLDSKVRCDVEKLKLFKVYNSVILYVSCFCLMWSDMMMKIPHYISGFGHPSRVATSMNDLCFDVFGTSKEKKEPKELISLTWLNLNMKLFHPTFLGPEFLDLLPESEDYLALNYSSDTSDSVVLSRLLQACEFCGFCLPEILICGTLFCYFGKSFCTNGILGFGSFLLEV